MLISRLVMLALSMESVFFCALVCTLGARLVICSSCNNDTSNATCNVTTACSDLGGECLDCSFPECKYGQTVEVSCTVKIFNNTINCSGEMMFERDAVCQFCYQGQEYQDYVCGNDSDCTVRRTPRSTYRALCCAKPEFLCMGNRTFYKRKLCNFTTGKRWTTTMLLSITLGGFGIDRFYLEQWGSAVGKLVSFGGLGVWTILDVILVATGYLGPADGSLYIY